LTAFLFEHRLGHLARAWLPELPRNINSQCQSLVAQALCLLDESDWQALSRLVEGRRWEGADYLRLALAARAWRELEYDTEADHAWIAALQAAGGNPQDFARLAKLADEWGWLAEHDQALWCVVRRFPAEQWALECLARTYAMRKDTFGLHQVNLIWATRCPNDPSAKNRLAATSLLLDLDSDRGHSLAWEAYASDPRNTSFAAIYAWSLHLQGQTVHGILLLKDLAADQSPDPFVALYFGALLAAAGVKDLAQRHLDIAAKGYLLSEERDILANAKARLK
jgi:hypothetical protein